MRSRIILLLFTFIHFPGYLFIHAQEMPRLMIDPQGHSGMISEIIITKDGKTMITASRDKSIRFWEIETGILLRTIRLQVGDDYNGTITAAALSPDEKYLAVSVIGQFNKLYDYIAIIDLDEFRQVGTLAGPPKVIEHIRDICYSPDGRFLACGQGSNAVIFRMPQDTAGFGKPLKYWVLAGHSGTVASVAYSPDGKKLATASYDYTIKLWNVARLDDNLSPTTLKTLVTHKKEVLKVVFSPDGKFLLSGGKDESLFLWDSYGTFLKGLTILENGVYTISLSGDGSRVFIMNDQQAMILDIFSGKLLYSLKGNAQALNFTGCYMPSGIFPSEGDFVVSVAAKDHSVSIVNMRNGKVIRKFKGNGVGVSSIGFSKNKLLAFGKEGNQLREKSNVKFDKAFDFDQMKFISGSGKFESNPLAFSGNIKEYKGVRLKLSGYYILLLSNGNIIKLDDSLTNEIYSYSFAPDGKVLVGTMFYINVYTQEGKLVTKLLGHVGPVQAMAVSADKKYLASAGADGTVNIWKLDDTGFLPEVTAVIPGGLASRYKFQPGDVIIAIDGHEIQSYDDFVQVLSGPGTFNFSIVRDHKTISIPVKRNDETFGFKFRYEKQPLLTFFTGSDDQWVCYSPEGYFTCSPYGTRYVIWHVNSGYYNLGQDYEAGRLFDKFYHPEIISEIYKSGDRDEDVVRKLGNKRLDITKSLNFIPRIKISIPASDESILVKGNRFAEKKNNVAVDSLPLQVQLHEDGGKIEKILLYQNDKLVDLRYTGSQVKKGGENTYTYQLKLLPGENRIRAIAVSNDGSESRPEEICIIYTGTGKKANLYMLAVGINEYQNPAYNLKFAVPDADSMVSAIALNSGNIFNSTKIKVLHNGDATKPELIKAFNEIQRFIEPQDVFVFYFSGHGAVNMAGDLDSSDFFLVMSDVNHLYGDYQELQEKAFSSKELNEWSVKIRAQKQIIILDACQSGAASQSFTGRGMTEERAIAQLARSAGIVVLAASSDNQFANEFASLGHGIFTYSLLEGLKGKADGINKDMKITVFELKAWVDDQVPELTKKYTGREQYPTGFSRGQDFPLKILKN